jgi:hypothetical protein
VAKQSGLGDRLFVAGYDLSGDIGSLDNIHGGPTLLDVTDITQSGNARIGGLRDGGLEFTAYFDPAADLAHKRLSTLPTTDVAVTYCRGATLGNPSAVLLAKQINYDGARGDDGSLVFTTEALANSYGLQWGEQLTAGKRTDTTATAGTAVDYGTSSAFGLQAFLHVFAFTGTSVTVKIQESSDNAGDAYADVVGGGFTAATGITSQRIATSASLAVERYLKITTTGTFSNAVFAVTVVRNLTTVVF